VCDQFVHGICEVTVKRLRVSNWKSLATSV
jgi:hypothetical protein